MITITDAATRSPCQAILAAAIAVTLMAVRNSQAGMTTTSSGRRVGLRCLWDELRGAMLAADRTVVGAGLLHHKPSPRSAAKSGRKRGSIRPRRAGQWVNERS